MRIAGSLRRRARARMALSSLFLAGVLSCSATSAQTVPAPSAEGNVLVATFNIHYTPAHHYGMEWEKRRNAVVDVLRDGGADVVGFQEMETFEGGSYNRKNIQLDWLREHFPEYRFGSVGDPAEYPSTQPIMYRKDRFEQLDQGFFFFSETPDRIYSRSWDGRFPAFCSWSRLRDSVSGTSFYVYNVHFDAGSRSNRVKAATLVGDRIAAREHPDDPVVLLGDINAPWYFKPSRILRNAGLEMADTAGTTFHFYRGIDILPAIDHVLVSPGFEPQRTWVLRNRYDGVWPSDHYPVVVELSVGDGGTDADARQH